MLQFSKHVEVPGYSVIRRRDRSENPNRGGVLSLCKTELSNCIVHVESSEVAERMWHYLIFDSGIYLFCNWYRPGQSENSHVTSFLDEFNAILNSRSSVKWPEVPTAPSILISYWLSLWGSGPGRGQ